MTTAGTPITDSRIAPGVEIVFFVHFKPQECKDYAYDVTVVTEREKFLIPLRALGPRPFLTFPDKLEFQSVTVKSSSTRTFVVRNIGSKVCQFNLSVHDHQENQEDETLNELSTLSKSLARESTTPILRGEEVWEVSPREGTVPVGGNMQITIRFKPYEGKQYKGRLVVSYSEGLTMVVNLEGRAHDANVFLDTNGVSMPKTYITLTSQKRFRLYNRSGMPVEYCWKAIHTRSFENEERLKLCEKLQELYERERQTILDQQAVHLASPQDITEEGDHYFEEEANMEANEYNAILPLDAKAKLSSVDRKYGNLFRQVMSDDLLFADGAFKIEPLQGTVWAHSHQEFTVFFTPPTAAEYKISSFLEVTGRSERLPLQLYGAGIGPKAAFNYDIMDVGDVFVSSVHYYSLTMINKGDIPADWSVLNPGTPFGSKFTFEPADGSLEVGASQNIMVIFRSDLLGEFSEIFEFKLQGSMEPLLVQFKGHVIGPTFHADVDELDFGIVPFEFLVTRKFKLYNTSDTKFTFDSRVPHDKESFEREFDISPPRVEIDADDSAEISVDFVSTNAKEYDCHLAVDVVGVGRDLLSIPIKARCVVPPVRSKDHQIEFGTAFLGYPYKKSVRLLNDGDQPARFEILPQEEQHAFVAAFHPFDSRGTIPPHEMRVIEFEFRAHRIGPISVPMHIKVSGTSVTILVELRARGSGPIVEAKPPVLDWGKIPCLQDRTLPVDLENSSLISAPFKTFLKNTRSKFNVDVPDGVIEPGEKMRINVTAHVDDTIQHKDQLYVVIENSDSVVIPLKAFGTGTTIYCDDDLQTIDFGFQFTRRPFKKSFILENRGRRTQTLFWANADAREKVVASRRNKEGPGETETCEVFSVEPATVTLKPRTACVFSVHGFSSSRGHIEETLECSSRVTDDKVTSVIFTSKTKAKLIQPMIVADPPRFYFEYSFEAGNIPAGVAPKEKTLQSAPLNIHNQSSLPLTCSFHCGAPFAIDPTSCRIPAKADQDLTLSFDPGFGHDLQTRTVDDALKVKYEEHPLVDTIPLQAVINFPNLELEYSHVDFGHVLNDTTKTQRVLVCNRSACSAEMSWSFLQDEKVTREANDLTSPYIPVNQVFDILPVRFRLEPYESKYVEFAFYAHEDRSFSGTAVCEVQGGPTYEVQLSGSGGSLGYKLDKDSIDFGQCLFGKQHEEQLVLHNTSRVNFSFNLRTSLLSREDVLAVSPQTGMISGGDRQTISIKLLPGVPGTIDETLILEVAHFEPIMVKVLGESINASIVAQLPRRISPLWEQACEFILQKFIDNIMQTDSSVQAGNVSSFMSSLSLESSEFSMSAAPMDIMGGGSSLADADRQQLIEAYRDAASTVLSNQAYKKLTRVETENVALHYTKKELICDIENESGRKVFADFLTTLSSEAPEGQVPSTVSWWTVIKRLKGKEDGVEKLLNKVSARGFEVLFLKKQRPGVAERFVASRFVLDFGTVILGSTKTRTCSISNSGPVSCTFSVESTIARALGFRVEPNKIANLPQGDSTSLSVEFFLASEKVDTGMPEKDSHYPATLEPKDVSGKLPMGKLTADVPLMVVNGPSIIVELRANVCVPHVKVLQPNQLDFGQLAVGQMMCASVELFNPCPISVSWKHRFGKKPGRSEDTSCFAVYPEEGTLLPSEHILVDVVFSANYSGMFHGMLQFVSDRRCPASIPVKAACVVPRVRIEPSVATFGPCFPCSASACSEVRVVNDEDKDVEIFSIDFDSSAKQEFMTISEAGTMGCANVLLRRFGVTGQNWFERLVNSDKIRSILAVPFYSSHDEFPMDIREYRKLGSLLGHNKERMLAASTTSPRGQGKAADLVVIGPPLSGKTALSKAIEERLQSLYLTIDDCVQWAREGYGGMELKDETLRELALSYIEYQKQQQERPETADSGKKQGKRSSARKSSMQPADNPVCSLEEALHMAEEKTLPYGAISKPTLCSILWERFTRADASKGIVMDDVRSSFVGKDDALRAVLTTASQFGSISVLNLRFSASAIVEWWKSLAGLSEERSSGDVEQKAQVERQTDQKDDEENPTVQHARALVQREVDVSSDDMASQNGNPPSSQWLQEENELKSTCEALVVASSDSVGHKGVHDSEQPELFSDAQSDENYGPSPNAHNSTESDVDKGESSENQNNKVVSEKNLKEVPTLNESPWMDVDVFGRNLEDVIMEIQNVIHMDERFSQKTYAFEDEEQIDSIPPILFTFQAKSENLVLPSNNLLSSQPYTETMTFLPKNSDGTHVFSVEADNEDAFRWTIPANSEVSLQVHFSSLSPGQFQSTLRFGLAGCLHELNLSCSGNATWPSINDDVSSLLGRCIRSRKRTPALSEAPFGPISSCGSAVIPTKRDVDLLQQHVQFCSEMKGQFVMNENCFDVGAVGASRIPVLRYFSTALDGSLSSDGNVDGALSKIEGIDESLTSVLREVASKHNATLRLQNYGLMTCTVNIGLLGPDRRASWRFSEDITFEDVSSEKTKADAGKRRASVSESTSSAQAPTYYADSDDIDVLTGAKSPQSIVDSPGDWRSKPASAFLIEPSSDIVLEPQEEKHIRIWAFPPEELKYDNTIVITVSENPQPILVPISCIGAKPHLSLVGESARFTRKKLEVKRAEFVDLLKQAEQQSTEDVSSSKAEIEKAFEELANKEAFARLDFGKLLKGKSEKQEFVVVNTSGRVTQWCIDPEYLASNRNIYVYPKEGSLNPSETAKVTVTYDTSESESSQELNSALPVLYADASAKIIDSICPGNEDSPLFTLLRGVKQTSLEQLSLAEAEFDDALAEAVDRANDVVSQVTGDASSQKGKDAKKSKQGSKSGGKDKKDVSKGTKGTGGQKGDKSAAAQKSTTNIVEACDLGKPVFHTYKGALNPPISCIVLRLVGETYEVRPDIKLTAPASRSATPPTKNQKKRRGSENKNEADLPQAPEMLDFGSLRVSDTVKRELTIENSGKYPMKVMAGMGASGKVHANVIRNRLKKLCGDPSVSQHFKITPEEKVLDPAETVTIEVSFEPSAEIYIQDSDIFEVSLLDALSGEANEVKQIKVRAFSYFSAFHFSPSRTINFGALHCDDSASRELEIFNDGKFEFTFEAVIKGSQRDHELMGLSTGSTLCIDQDEQERATPLKGEKGKGKKDPKRASTEATADVLQNQAFQLLPKLKSVPPGEKVTITTSFNAKECAEGVLSSHIRFHISGASNSSETEKNSSYTLVGESCVPKVSADWNTMFEEHMLIDKEKDMEMTNPFDRPPTFAAQERKFNIGIDSSPSALVSERFRLLNPSKVFTKVEIKVTGLNQEQALTAQRLGPDSVAIKAGKQDTESPEQSAFTVAPASIEMAPYDSRYLNVELSTTSIGVFFALIQVFVVNSPEKERPATWFIVCCEKTLPQLQIIHPKKRSSNGNICAEFSQLSEGDQEESSFTVYNSGKVPCSAHFASSLSQIAMDGDILGEDKFALCRQKARQILSVPHERSIKLFPGEQSTLSMHARVPSDFVSLLKQLLNVDAINKISISCLCTMHVLNNKFARETVEVRCDIERSIVQITSLPPISSLWVSRKKQQIESTTEESKTPAGKGKKGGKAKRSSMESAPAKSQEEPPSGPHIVLGELIVPKCENVSAGIETALQHLVDDKGMCGYKPVSLSVVNASTRPARCQWRTSQPFEVCPQTFHLPAGEQIKSTISFRPSELGTFLEYQAYLEVSFVSYHKDILNQDLGGGAEESSSKPKSKKTAPVATGSDGVQESNMVADMAQEAIVNWKSDDAEVRFVQLDSEEGILALQFPENKPKMWKSVSVDKGRNRAKIWEYTPEPNCRFCSESGYVLKASALHELGRDENGLVPKKYASLQRKVRLSAVAETPEFELSESRVRFDATMMYRSRVREISVNNKGNISSECYWSFSRIDTTDETSLPIPYSVNPEKKLLAANSKEIFNIDFSPVEVDDHTYEGICEIPALRHRHYLERLLFGDTVDDGSLRLQMSGIVQRPVIHVDLRKSDYFTSGRRSLELPSFSDNVTLQKLLGSSSSRPLSELVHVIEITSLGVMVRNKATFYVVNPTANDYRFSWEKLTELSPPSAEVTETPFRCKTYSGVILSGGRYEMVFEYNPKASHPVEGLYRLSIPSNGIALYFLVVGRVREPCVRFDPPRCSFPKLLVGSTETQTLKIVNDEKIPFHYFFDQNDLSAAMENSKDGGNSIQVVFFSSTSGRVPPGAAECITVAFRPQLERRYNFNFKCNIAKRSSPLTLNIKGEGYQLIERVLLGDELRETSPIATNPVAFGSVRVGEQASKVITVFNQGIFPFEFNAMLRSPTSALGSASVSVVPEKTRIPPGDKATMEVIFSPKSLLSLHDVELEVNIAGTKVYRFSLSGESTYPQVRTSVKHVSFGSCLVPPASCIYSLPAHRRVYVHNREDYSSVNVTLQSAPQSLDIFSLAFEPQVLDPGEETYFDITFTPREFRTYTDTIQLLVDEKYPINVGISGEGVPLSVVPLHQPMVDFGAPPRMSRIQRQLELVNQSRTRLSVTLCQDTDSVSTLAQTGDALTEARDYGVTVSPTTAVLPPNRRSQLGLNFVPQRRFDLKQFRIGFRLQGLNEVIDAKTNSVVSHELTSVTALAEETIEYGLSEWIECFYVRAGCHDVDVNLESDALHFTGVCEGSHSTKQLRMTNTGDIGISFSWDLSRIQKDFDVKPSKGFLSAHSDQVLDVTFYPSRIAPDIRYPNVTCQIDETAPLYLTLSGECVSKPEEAIDEMEFQCRVRESQTRQITLPKLDDSLFPSSDKPVYLHPVIDSTNWSCPASVAVKKQESAKLDITFRPCQMTSQAEHSNVVNLPDAVKGKERPVALEGSLFLSLPNGEGLLYRLKGQADAPEAITTVENTTPAKSQCSVNIDVANWLAKLQRLNVYFSKVPETCTLQGPKMIEIPPLSSKKYSATFQNMLEQSQDFTIAFVNEESGEYCWVKCRVTTEKADIFSTLELSSRCRKPVTSSLQIRNPFKEQESKLTFTEPVCSHSSVFVRYSPTRSTPRTPVFSVLYVPLQKTSSRSSREASKAGRPSSGQDKKGKSGKKGGKETVEDLQVGNLPTPPDPASPDHETAVIGIRCHELGDFFYALQLRATAPEEDPAIHFEVELGRSTTKPFHFKHYSLSSCTYDCRIESVTPDASAFFDIPSTVEVQGASLTDQENELDIVPSDGIVYLSYQPGSLGNTEATLILQSKSDNMQYSAGIRGTCSSPRPIGPLNLGSAGLKTVKFKNVLNTQATYSIACDTAYFRPGSDEMTLNAKAESDVTVTADRSQSDSESSGVVRTGKLVIRCATYPELPPWVFYLQHDPSESTTSTSAPSKKKGKK